MAVPHKWKNKAPDYTVDYQSDGKYTHPEKFLKGFVTFIPTGMKAITSCLKISLLLAAGRICGGNCLMR